MSVPVPEFREATRADLSGIVSMLADDPLGSTREAHGEDVASAYLDAFEAIDADPNHRLLVADLDGEIAGVMQLSFIPHLTYVGGWRAQVEGVRVAKAYRSRGVGRALFEYAIREAAERGCHLVQLTTDRRRPDALRFYIELGFELSHHGLKLHLTGRDDRGSTGDS